MRSPSCARPKSCAVGARRHQPQFGDAYRTTALGAQRVHGKGLEVKGVPNPLARLTLHSALVRLRCLRAELLGPKFVPAANSRW